jgi:hypothetical protein
VTTAFFLPFKLLKINKKIKGRLKIKNPVNAFGGHTALD